MSYRNAFVGILMLPLLACEPNPGSEVALDSCIRDSDCASGQTCDRGRCVAIIPEEEKAAPAPNELPKPKIKRVHPFEITTSAQPGEPPTTPLDTETKVASVPISELGIGPARLGMLRSEWFSVPKGEFAPPLATDPDGVDARGLAKVGEADLLALFKGGVLCQLSTRSDRAATALGVRPGDTAARVEERYGAISEVAPRYAEDLKGIYFIFRSPTGGDVPSPGPVPKDAIVDEIIVGSCL